MTERRVAGRYHLLEPIGEGGMGVVWRAHDELLDRVVAVKEVRYRGVDEATQDELNRRTIREAKTAGRLDHPSVIIVHDVIEEGGRPWIVMQLVRSRSLGEVVRERGPLPPGRVASVGLSVLSALRAAHAAGILHRDVKPENVLLADDDRVVLTDFGIAATTQEPGITRTGGMVGTPAFLPPERLHGLPAGPESDLWSLGATLYAALEGHPPFQRPTAAATMMAVLQGEPGPMTHGGPLSTAILGLMTRDPAARMGAAEAEVLLARAAGRPLPGDIPPSREPARPVPPPHGTQPWEPGREPGGDEPRPRHIHPAGPGEPGPGPFPPQSAHLGHTPHPPRPAQTPYPSRSGRPPHPGEPAAQVRPEHSDAPVRTGRTAHSVGPVHPWPLPPPDGPAHPGEPSHRGSPTLSDHPAHAGDPRHAPRQRGRRVALMVGVPVLALAAGAGGWLVLQDRAAGTAVVSTTEGPTGGPVSPPATPSGDPVVPKGWRLHEDPLGFSLAIPRTWSVKRFSGRDRVEFRAPGSAAFLWVESTEDPETDPVEHWEKVEEGGTADGVWPGYERISITPLTYLDRPAADWEFTFRRDGVPVRVLDRGFRTADGTPYAIYWESPEATWDRAPFDRLVKTFRP
ncbi:protein kinase [Planomonospora sp. ID67723]|uniref:serine/threonine-protein kinase n=1 Tax=Planomonospora sp. ID67723 TaxID=2738134 RepID=UPI0018C3ABA7|nr:serine/threonine-protein kinase [Planomonospora sp. ID67723]MBG0829537.1 protein kinase [Planomonospora sp. ID67723]